MDKIKICSIVGPTASGKSMLGVYVAKKIGGEIISADSMQVYEGMDIATAKLSEREQGGVPHHMINFLKIDSEFSVADYVFKANEIIDDIISRKKIPILVGGTGLYINSLLNGISFVEKKEVDFDVRNFVENELKINGPEYMFEKLKRIDQEYAQKVHPNNLKRVLRGLEIFYSTGLKVSECLEYSRKKGSRFNCLKIGLNFLDRSNLYRIIELRVDDMIRKGLLFEAEEMFKKKFSKTSFQALGYKELEPFFLGEKKLEEVIFNLKQKTKKYAKRQLTWFRRDSEINWFNVDEIYEEELRKRVLKLIIDFLKTENKEV